MVFNNTQVFYHMLSFSIVLGEESRQFLIKWIETTKFHSLTQVGITF